MKAKENAVSVAAILTSYNRRETTLRCLTGLYAQEGLGEVFTLEVYLFDDNSPDCTAKRVSEAFPQVRLQTGDGTNFWNGGMRAAFGQAMGDGYDFYLWVNDDTHLYPDAIGVFLDTYHNIGKEDTVIVGNVRDPETGRLSYGGLISPYTNKLKSMGRPAVDGEPRPCDTLNGNCVLIPCSAAERVGNLDGAFTHKMADMDYGYRCVQAGASLYATGVFVGECARHGELDPWRRPGATLKERYRALTGPKGLPVGEWKEFCRRYAGPWWILYWLAPYVKALVPPRG